MRSIVGVQEGKQSFKRLGKICTFVSLLRSVYSKGGRGLRYRKNGTSDKSGCIICLYLVFHVGKDPPNLRESPSFKRAMDPILYSSLKRDTGFLSKQNGKDSVANNVLAKARGFNFEVQICLLLLCLVMLNAERVQFPLISVGVEGTQHIMPWDWALRF